VHADGVEVVDEVRSKVCIDESSDRNGVSVDEIINRLDGFRSVIDDKPTGSNALNIPLVYSKLPVFQNRNCGIGIRIGNSSSASSILSKSGDSNSLIKCIHPSFLPKSIAKNISQKYSFTEDRPLYSW
jgi:hypothetical protein